MSAFYEQPDVLPDFLMRQGFAPEEPLYEPDLMAGLGPTEQQPMPNDFFARMAMGTGGQGVQYDPGPRPTGLEFILSALAGFANAKTRQAGQRIGQVQEQNKQSNENARALANRRWEIERDKRREGAEMRKLIAASGAKAPRSRGEPKVVMENGKRVYRYPDEAVGKEAPTPEPAAPNMIPMVMPDGSLGWGNPKDPPPGSAPPIPRGSKLPAGALSDFSDEVNTIRQTDDVLSLYRPEFVGPVSGGIRGSIAAKTGRGLMPGEAEFRSAVATYANKARNILFGSALTAVEKEEAYKQLPDAKNPSGVFEANIETTRNNLKRANRLRRETYEASGYDLSRFPAVDAPAGGGPDDKVTIIRDGQRGTVSRKFIRPTDQVVN